MISICIKRKHFFWPFLISEHKFYTLPMPQIIKIKIDSCCRCCEYGQYNQFKYENLTDADAIPKLD